MSAPVDFYEGTNFNFIQDYLSYIPLKYESKEEDTFTINYHFYILNYYNFENAYFYFIKNWTFSSSPNFWNVTDESINQALKNTSTEKTISTVKEKLANDKSDKVNY